MLDIVFVILVYNVLKEAPRCINSIKKRIDTSNFKIVVVDNGSNNNIGASLAEKYKNDPLVTVKLLPENIGFAKGNNAGIEIARKFGTKYICCLNDDTRLLSRDLIKSLDSVYTEYNAALIGPCIIERDGKECNYNHELKTVKQYEKILKGIKEDTFEPGFAKDLLYMFKRSPILTPVKMLRNTLSRFVRTKRFIYQKNTVDLVLHGSCLFFTPTFFRYLDGFNPDTFLYYEEEILAAALKTNNLHSVYAPKIRFTHLQGISTANSLRQREKLWTFTNKYFEESIKILIDYMKSNNLD